MKNNNLRRNKLKSSKGAVSLLVAITIFTFIAILTGTYLTIMILRQSQYDSNYRIQEVYGKDVNRIDEVYLEVTEIIENWNTEKQVNSPKLLTGMTPIKFEYPTEDAMGETVTTIESDTDWYEYGTTYETKRWANAQTEDGSMWVWIPRFAYRIDSDNQKVDVVFLMGATDYYYDENGIMQTAKRCTTETEKVDTTKGYTVHPAFTDESNINYRNGGWDEELTGIWVAKFEAGYASGNNTAEVVASNVNYSQTTAYVKGIERGTDEEGNTLADGSELARNWLDGIYGETETSIKYPVFMPLTYTMNYINHNDSYNIAKALTDSGNIYGLLRSNTDSHLMKNSEWGAIAYLSQSKYGQNGTEITINNASLNSGSTIRTETAGKAGVNSVYAVTGCTSNTTNTKENITTISAINSVSGNTANANGIYVWNQRTGQNASTTGTIYGIYDMSGGVWERTASYISNGNTNLKDYGESIAYSGNVLKTESTKYTTVYPYSSPESTTTDTASQNNFANNTKIYGDAVRETTSSNAGTSNSGWNTSSWNSDYSYFPGYGSPLFTRGGSWNSGSNTGEFAFTRHYGSNYYFNGFRVVLCAL